MLRALRPRGALGLRGRIVGVVLVTTAAALAVAAVALLGPLVHSLKGAELKTLEGQVTSNSVTAFKRRDPALALQAHVPGPLRADGERVLAALGRAERSLAGRIGASEVALVSPAVGSSRGLLLLAEPDEDLARSDPFDDVIKAFRSGRPIYSFGSIAGVDFARAAIPFTTLSTPPEGRPPMVEHWVLAVRKPMQELNNAVAAVRTAFLYAALAGAALTLLLAIPLAARIVRRLRRLRQAALRLAEEGPAVHVPVDRARDEVGDLARTFALMQGQLQRQEEARRAFVATASHELRTPLASLDGMLELLEDDLSSGQPDLDDAQALLRRARSQSRRLGRLAADLLDLSRLDAQLELRSEPVELGELSRAVLAEFELVCAERGVETVLDEHDAAVWALGDPGGVARILRILLDNAVRVSPPGGRVTVSVANGRRASLTVSDEGPGVRPEERELIFERFKRGSASVGRAGFGLGLAIGRELASRMGGELTLESVENGSGARFTVALPAACAPEEQPLAFHA
jgi:signal transduction histidine kinase